MKKGGPGEGVRVSMNVSIATQVLPRGPCKGRAITAKAPPVADGEGRKETGFGVWPTCTYIPTLTLNCYIVLEIALTYPGS